VASSPVYLAGKVKSRSRYEVGHPACWLDEVREQE
jgi:hypothetical protein